MYIRLTHHPDHVTVSMIDEQPNADDTPLVTIAVINGQGMVTNWNITDLPDIQIYWNAETHFHSVRQMDVNNPLGVVEFVSETVRESRGEAANAARMASRTHITVRGTPEGQEELRRAIEEGRAGGILSVEPPMQIRSLPEAEHIEQSPPVIPPDVQGVIPDGAARVIEDVMGRMDSRLGLSDLMQSHPRTGLGEIAYPEGQSPPPERLANQANPDFGDMGERLLGDTEETFGVGVTSEHQYPAWEILHQPFNIEPRSVLRWCPSNGETGWSHVFLHGRDGRIQITAELARLHQLPFEGPLDLEWLGDEQCHMHNFVGVVHYSTNHPARPVQASDAALGVDTPSGPDPERLAGLEALIGNNRITMDEARERFALNQQGEEIGRRIERLIRVEAGVNPETGTTSSAREAMQVIQQALQAGIINQEEARARMADISPRYDVAGSMERREALQREANETAAFIQQNFPNGAMLPNNAQEAQRDPPERDRVYQGGSRTSSGARDLANLMEAYQQYEAAKVRCPNCEGTGRVHATGQRTGSVEIRRRRFIRMQSLGTDPAVLEQPSVSSDTLPEQEDDLRD